jgi:multiple sugar transport system ATP-binding protein
MASIRLEQVTKRFTPSPIFTKYMGRRILRTPSDISKGDAANNTQESVLALNDVNFQVPDGQTTVVVGPSGCGKSTLLRAIAGLIEYDGAIYYDDRNMRDVPVKERRIGMVFQNYALYPHFYGHGNLSFFFKVNKAPDAETEARIRYTSEIMGIGFPELLKRKPGTLSGGQQQRIAIGRAIVRQPELFLFDEPLSNLDAKLRTRTRVEIKRLLHRFNITAVYVTHDQTEALALADEIAVMREGRMEQVGPYQRIISNPINQFVAGFLGLPPMNLLTCSVEESALFLDDINVSLPSSAKQFVHQGQFVTLGIRPEKIFIGTLPTDENLTAYVRIPSVVEVIEPDFGRKRVLVYLRYNALTFCATAPIDAQVHIGYTIDAYLPLSEIYLFDTESGSRIC